MTSGLIAILALSVFQAPISSPQNAPQTPPPASAVPSQLAPVNVIGIANATADDQRLVCSTQAVVGTNRRQRVCMTVAERNERRESSRSQRDRLDRPVNAANASDGPSVQSMRGF